ncbi:MAG: hypothetical protein JNM56_18420 [Planctomycetia bacterium]|nr:hypothetical protein [Planctomycetia bacterium]
MEQTLVVLNELEAQGHFTRYAIGGAIALLFYTEPVLTYDLDVFCLLPTTDAPLITPSPVYDYLKSRGFEPEHEHIMIAGVPVQFIPAYNDLILEAVEQAAVQPYKQTWTRVLSYEHLLAIMVQMGRPKDRARLTQALDERQPDEALLRSILERHGLLTTWESIGR